MPVGVAGRGAGGTAIEAAGGEVEGFDDGRGGDARLGEGGGRADDGDARHGVCGGAGDGDGRGSEIEREELIDGELLRSEDAIEAFERESAPAVEEVGDVGLAEAGELGETSSGEGAGLDAAGEFLTKEFVEIGEVHEG